MKRIKKAYRMIVKLSTLELEDLEAAVEAELTRRKRKESAVQDELLKLVADRGVRRSLDALRQLPR